MDRELAKGPCSLAGRHSGFYSGQENSIKKYFICTLEDTWYALMTMKHIPYEHELRVAFDCASSPYLSPVVKLIHAVLFLSVLWSREVQSGVRRQLMFIVTAVRNLPPTTINLSSIRARSNQKSTEGSIVALTPSKI